MSCHGTFASLIAKSLLLVLPNGRARQIHNFIAHIAQRSSSGRLQCGSLCTGSGVSALCTEALLTELCATTALPEIPLDHVLACEKDAAKQAWISELPSFQRAACIPDVTAFGIGARARDWRSGVVVDLDMELHLLDAGFSCKDLSNLNVDGEPLRVWVKGALGKVERDSMQLPASIEERGTTVPARLGVLRCIIQNRPWFVFLENVSAAFELRDEMFTLMAFMGHPPLVMNSALLTCFGLYSVPVLDVSWSTSIIEELTS